MSIRPLPVAAGLVAAEGAAVFVVSAVYLVAVTAGHPHSRAVGLFGAALGLAAGAVLVGLGRGLGAGRRWARAPVVLLQLLAVPVAIGLLQAGLVGAGLAVLLPPVAVLALLAAPTARAPFEPPG